MADNKSCEGKRSIGTLTIHLDCSDALTGLKAIQREARKATAALKELEEQQKKVPGIVAIKSNRCPKCRGDRLEVTTMKELSSNSVVKEETMCLDCGWVK